jgi:hypothetical protein
MFKMTEKTLWPESASQLYRLRDRRLSAISVSTFSDRGVSCSPHSKSLHPYSQISRLQLLIFLPSSFPIALTRLSGPLSRPPVLLRKSGSAWNRTRTSGSVARNSEH